MARLLLFTSPVVTASKHMNGRPVVAKEDQ